MSPFTHARPGEVAIDLPQSFDADIYFIGRMCTPWKELRDCPRNSQRSGDAVAYIDLDPLFAQGLVDIELCSHLTVLYWLHLSRRDLIQQMPSHVTAPRGVFGLRSPVRPNPIGLSVVELVKVEGARLTIRNIDCVDGTPVVDIKPYFASTDSFPDAKRP